MMGEEEVIATFKKNSKDFEVAVVEGVMGLYDSADISTLDGSTAHVAQILNIPVLLVVNAKGIAGTIAPLVKGFIDYRPGVKILGIIANNVGSEKHATLLKDALTLANLPPLLGFLPRDSRIVMQERHLGLVPVTENNEDNFYNIIADSIEKNFKLDEILEG
jgi:cobyrinic acid a,c-diamide synthase